VCGCVRMKSAVSVMSVPINLWRKLACDRAGVTTVGFAVAVSMFTALVVGIAQGGLLLFDEVELANAASVGSRTFMVARQPSCFRCVARPYTSTLNAVATAGSLQLASANVSLAVGGAPCSSDATCLAALNAAHFSGAYYSSRSQASVTVTYPCPKLLPSALFETIGVCPSGNLSLKISQQVE
jgi:Flp pilus assembly protein TadG